MYIQIYTFGRLSTFYAAPQTRARTGKSRKLRETYGRCGGRMDRRVNGRRVRVIVDTSESRNVSML